MELFVFNNTYFSKFWNKNSSIFSQTPKFQDWKLFWMAKNPGLKNISCGMPNYLVYELRMQCWRWKYNNTCFKTIVYEIKISTLQIILIIYDCIFIKGKTTFRSLSPLTNANLYFGNILSFFDSNVINTCQGNFWKKNFWFRPLHWAAAG